jgi:branched-chain amino acid transport system ATP-binding protein
MGERLRRYWPLIVFVSLLIVAPFAASQFYVTLLNYIGLYALVVLGVVLLTGVAGQVSFGQAAFVGLGAYTSGYLTTVYGLSPWLTLFAGLLFTGVVAVVLGFLTLRMRGHYLPLGTIAWAISFYYIFGNVSFLGGFSGLSEIPLVRLFGWALKDARAFYFLIWLALLGALWAVHNLLDSRTGRAIRALRGGGQMAESFGVDTAALKIRVFLYAALLASISGWLYAHLQRFVNPTPFGLNAGIEFLFMAVVGGAGHIWGALLGAGLITVLKQWLQDVLPRLLGSSGNFEIIVFGILIIVMLQLARDGLWPLIAKRFSAARLAPARIQAEPLAKRSRLQHGVTVLEVKGARKQFGGLVAVNDLSFTVCAGEILGLIGPNGAGKSTMFNLISGALAATKGEVNFLGSRIDRLDAPRIARLGIARTFQYVKLLPAMSVLDNVAIGAHMRGSAGMLRASLRLDRKEEARLQADAWMQLERVGLAAQALEPAGTLPLGKQRIVEIARALAADPLLLLLDEPAAGLRHLEKAELARLLSQLRGEGMSLLLVEHDMEFVMNLVDRLVVMSFGAKLAEGEPRDVSRNPAVLEAYLGGVT